MRVYMMVARNMHHSSNRDCRLASKAQYRPLLALLKGGYQQATRSYYGPYWGLLGLYWGLLVSTGSFWGGSLGWSLPD